MHARPHDIDLCQHTVNKRCHYLYGTVCSSPLRAHTHAHVHPLPGPRQYSGTCNVIWGSPPAAVSSTMHLRPSTCSTAAHGEACSYVQAEATSSYSSVAMQSGLPAGAGQWHGVSAEKRDRILSSAAASACPLNVL
eukprot:352800-Chlamydomonas_euryale.AAC.3